MTALLAMLACLAGSGQEASSGQRPVTTLSTVEVTAPVREAAVTLECVVRSSGRLSDCVVLSETPPGQGFGAAALAGARTARLAR
ncbi:MAG TPA: hypothetical protein VLJ13_04515, partial [Brevundimonas sp.]|nr:hypothetical protein [Brevundimonas sp.]